MIEKIAGIRLQGANFTEKTDLPLFGEYRYSLLYGRNGAGKSTTARAFSKISGNEEANIRKAALIDGRGREIKLRESDKSAIHIFNEDFIEENIRLQEDGLETIVILGEQKRIDDKIRALDKKMRQLSQQNEKEQAKLERCENPRDDLSPEKYLNSIKRHLKGDNNWAMRDSQLSGKSKASSVTEEKIKELAELKPAAKEDELWVLYGTKYDEYLSVKSQVLVISEQVRTDYSLEFDEKQFQQLLRKKIARPNLTKREKRLIEELDRYGSEKIEGIRDYFTDKGSDICPYCLQNVGKEYRANLIKSIEKVLSEESKQHQEELEKFRLSEIVQEFDPYLKLDKKLIQIAKTYLGQYNSAVRCINKCIDEKKSNVFKAVKPAKFAIKAKFDRLISVLCTLEEKRIQYNANVTDEKSRCAELREINDQLAHHRIASDWKKYKRYLRNRDKQSSKVEKLKSELENLQSEIAVLETRKENVKIALNVINRALEYIFCVPDRLRIEVKNDKYILFSGGKTVSPRNISVGERNVIALCYFFTNIMQNIPKGKVYDIPRLIVIDDPISSFDFENKVGINSYINSELSKFLLENKDTKVLVMTHDLRSYYDLDKILVGIMKKSEYRFNRREDISKVELKNKRLYFINKKYMVNEYSTLMKLIYDFAAGKGDENRIFIGNAMRRTMEAFSTFLYKKSIIELTKDEMILKDIPQLYREYFYGYMSQLVFHGESHMEERVKTIADMDFLPSVDFNEMQRVAKDVLCFVYLLNKSHLLAHLATFENDGVVEKQLDDWVQELEQRLGGKKVLRSGGKSNGHRKG